jgi:hypothetical protein
MYKCMKAKTCNHPFNDSNLLLLGATAARTLSGLNGLLVALGRATLHGAHETGRLLEGTLEVTSGRLAKDVNLDHVVLESALERDDALDEKRVGVVHVQVHESHHGHTHGLATESGADLLVVVGVNGGGDELALLRGTHRSGLNILEGGEVLLLVDLQLGVEVETSNDNVAGKVDGTDNVEHKRIIERNALGDLHHTQDDDQVGDLRRESHLDYWFEDTGEEGLG